MIRFACPTCRTVLTVADDKVGQKTNCPDCGQRLQVPAPKVREKPRERNQPDANPFDFASDQGTELVPTPAAGLASSGPVVIAPSSPLNPPAFQQQIIVQQPGEQTDAPGVISLILGSIALLTLPLACCTYGVSLIATTLIGAIGAGLGFMAKGNLRVAGLTLNLLAVTPAVIGGVILIVLSIIAVMSEATRQPQQNRSSPTRFFDQQ